MLPPERMRKIGLISFLFFTSLGINAQSFHKRAVVFDLNTGIEFYNTTLNYKTNRLSFNGDTVVLSKAGNANVSLGVEIGLGKRVGIGLRGKANQFFSDVDAVTEKNTDITSTDLLFMINIHPVVRKKLDIILGSEFGVSGFNVRMEDLDHTLISGNGGFFSVYLNPRVYLGRFGFNLKTYLPFVWYQDLKSNAQEFDKFLLSQWKGNGIGVAVGVQVRLF